VLHRPVTWDFFRTWPFEDDAWELYRVAEDPNELHDLALTEPAKLQELQSMFDAEARRNNVYPLGPDFMGYRRQQVAAQIAQRKGLFSYSGVVRGISNDAAPPTYRSAFELRATVEVTATGTQVLVAHGGAMGGYSLYIKEGVPVYCYNLLGGDLTYLRGKGPLPAGRHEVIVRFRPDGKGAANLTMQVDDANPTQGLITKLTPMMYEASDGFSVGLDQGSSVSPETVSAEPAAVREVRFTIAMDAQPRG
jgi:arylsulfatase